MVLQELTEGYKRDSFSPAELCPICGGESKIAHEAINAHPEKPFRFDLRSCLRCAHAWIDPMPHQELLDYLYERGSRSVIGEWGPGGLSVPEAIILEREGNRPRGRYFELGVGQGHLYQEFARRGWACRGVDPGPWAQKFPNVSRDFNAAGEIKAHLLVALDVLEHVVDPISMLRRLRELAASGATLYCAMPNCQSLRARLQRERWRMIRPLGHVNYWSRDSIRTALSAAGFELSWMTTSDLWRGPIRSPGDLIRFAIDRLGLGDQWIVEAAPKRN